jgi:hypothetical protein
VRAKRYILCYYIPIAKLLQALEEYSSLFSDTWKCTEYETAVWWVIFALQHRAKI